MGLIESVEIKKSEDRMADVYVKAYEKRYGVQPFFDPNGPEPAILRTLIRNLGTLKVSYVLEHYLTMDNEWFVTKGHSLLALKRDINVVIADMGVKKRGAVHSHSHYLTPFWCDECGKRTVFDVPFQYNWDTRTLCKECGGSLEYAFAEKYLEDQKNTARRFFTQSPSVPG